MTDRLDTWVLGFWSSIKVKSDLRCFEKSSNMSKFLQKIKKRLVKKLGLNPFFRCFLVYHPKIWFQVPNPPLISYLSINFYRCMKNISWRISSLFISYHTDTRKLLQHQKFRQIGFSFKTSQIKILFETRQSIENVGQYFGFKSLYHKWQHQHVRSNWFWQYQFEF